MGSSGDRMPFLTPTLLHLGLGPAMQERSKNRARAWAELLTKLEIYIFIIPLGMSSGWAYPPPGAFDCKPCKQLVI